MAKIFNNLMLFVSKLLDKFSDFDKEFENFDKEFDFFYSIGTFLPIIMFAGMFIAVIVVVIVSIVKAKRKTSEIATKVKDTIKEKIEQEKTKDICPYCGTKLGEKENKCPGCGARRK